MDKLTQAHIKGAKDGGFVVQKMDWGSGYESIFLYAGSLPDCLEYLRRELGAELNTTPVCGATAKVSGE